MYFLVLITVQAFQALSEYLQLLDSLSELSVTQEMNHGVEVNVILQLGRIHFDIRRTFAFFLLFALQIGTWIIKYITLACVAANSFYNN